MRARIQLSMATVPSAQSVTAAQPLLSRLLRGGLGLAGLSWICFASTLCGCSGVNGFVMNESGKAYYRRGDYTAARHEFERALMDSPHNANYAHNVASAMQQQGDVMSAEKMYQHALVLDPGHEQSYNGLAHLLYNNNRTDEAEQLLTAWSETQPYEEESSLALARFSERTGNDDLADRAYDRAAAVNPRVARRSARRRSSGSTAPDNPYAESDISLAGYQSPALLMAQQMPMYDPTLQPSAISFFNAGTPSMNTAPYIGSANIAPPYQPSIYQHSYPSLAGGLPTNTFQLTTPATVPTAPMMANRSAVPMGQTYIGGPMNGMAVQGQMPAMMPQSMPSTVMPASATMPALMPQPVYQQPMMPAYGAPQQFTPAANATMMPSF